MGEEEFAGKPLFIKELIRRVHRELVDSQKEREENQEEPLFFVEKLVVEANFAIVESKGAKGGIDLKFITLGKQRDYSEQQVHKITLTLSSMPSQEITSGSKKPAKSSKSQTQALRNFPKGYLPAPPDLRPS